jgi:hypothetical protein
LKRKGNFPYFFDNNFLRLMIFKWFIFGGIKKNCSIKDFLSLLSVSRFAFFEEGEKKMESDTCSGNMKLFLNIEDGRNVKSIIKVKILVFSWLFGFPFQLISLSFRFLLAIFKVKPFSWPTKTFFHPTNLFLLRHGLPVWFLL